MVSQSDPSESGGSRGFFRPAPPEIQPVSAERLYNGLICGPDLQQADVLWIDDMDTLTARFKHIADAGSPPVVDFERHGVLLITMGERPTAGYRLNFLPGTHRVVLRGRTLQVDLAWETPPPDSIQAQVMTYPCLLLQVPRRSFNRVEIIDQNGAVRLSVDRRGNRTAGS